MTSVLWVGLLSSEPMVLFLGWLEVLVCSIARVADFGRLIHWRQMGSYLLALEVDLFLLAAVAVTTTLLQTDRWTRRQGTEVEDWQYRLRLPFEEAMLEGQRSRLHSVEMAEMEV